MRAIFNIRFLLVEVRLATVYGILMGYIYILHNQQEKSNNGQPRVERVQTMTHVIMLYDS